MMKKIFLLLTIGLLAQWASAQCLSGDCIDGSGTARYENGDQYTGTFANAKRHGKGEMFFANGSKFAGEFQNDLPHGRGIMTFRNGSKYLGFFAHGQRNGHGVLYNQEGEVQRCGIWTDGKLSSETEETAVLRKLGLNAKKTNPREGRLRITNKGVVVVNDDEPVVEPKQDPKKEPKNDPVQPVQPNQQVVVQPKEEPMAKPEIQITQPAAVVSRGFKVVSSQPVNVSTTKNTQAIAGSVSAQAGLSELRINGRPVSVDAQGRFSTEVKMFPGKNEVYLVATDKKGQVGERIVEIEAQGDITAVVDTTHKPMPKAPANQKRLALLIGNSNYEGGGQLRNPVNDVRAIEQVLKRLGFDVMKYEDLDQRGMKKAIDNYGTQLMNYDVGLFFYAGHGLQVKGTNYLVPISGHIENEQDAEYECIDTGRILSKMEAAQTKVNILILDACRNNPFERSWSRSTAGKGLATINAPMGSFIAYATAPGTTASDGSGDNGLYTENLLRTIESPGITIEEVFRKVRAGVVQQSNKDQVPWDSSSLTGEFYFK